MDEIETKRALQALSEYSKTLNDELTRQAIKLITAILIEHTKAIQELTDAGDDC